MINLFKNKMKPIINIVSILLILLILILLTIYDFSLIFFIVPILIILGLWKLSKGKWEKRISREDARKWRRSIIFTIYLVLFIVSSLLIFYLGINRPPQISNEPPNILNYLADLNMIGFALFINIIFITFCIWKKAPKQILSIPFVYLILGMTPGLIGTFISLKIFENLYAFSVLPILQIFWGLYVRFKIFSKK
ncbi:hypothetical protein GOV12_04525 [Candidatus Pacearchaeota archaeon]|nr:hypothetical protein [Candidatus Pacearchaeota archaeon]